MPGGKTANLEMLDPIHWRGSEVLCHRVWRPLLAPLEKRLMSGDAVSESALPGFTNSSPTSLAYALSAEPSGCESGDDYVIFAPPIADASLRAARASRASDAPASSRASCRA